MAVEAARIVGRRGDLAVICEAVEERCGHLGTADDAGPFTEGEAGGDDDQGVLAEAADQVDGGDQKTVRGVFSRRGSWPPDSATGI